MFFLIRSKSCCAYADVFILLHKIQFNTCTYYVSWSEESTILLPHAYSVPVSLSFHSTWLIFSVHSPDFEVLYRKFFSRTLHNILTIRFAYSKGKEGMHKGSKSQSTNFILRISKKSCFYGIVWSDLIHDFQRKEMQLFGIDYVGVAIIMCLMYCEMIRKEIGVVQQNHRLNLSPRVYVGRDKKVLN